MAEEGRSGLGGRLPAKGLPHNLRPKTRSYPALAFDRAGRRAAFSVKLALLGCQGRLVQVRPGGPTIRIVGARGSGE